ncbi:MAG: AAA family ATPase, partial [Deltaproteobacteria bacterium]|nr:AAA family ATPase [Deltaproteobacteria bacterium]
MIASDLGVKTAASLIEDIKEEILAGREVDYAQLIRMLKDKVTAILGPEVSLHPYLTDRARKGPFVVLIAGVNGVGKTTTVVKLAYLWQKAGYKVMIAAADTFRAAAVEQLQRWVEEREIPLVSGDEGAKPATVVFEAMQRALREEIDILIIDTAGRLHNRANLMAELEGVRRSIKKHQADAPHET